MLPPFFLLACGWFLLAKGKVFFCQEPWKYWHREQVKFQLNQQGFRSECRIHHCLRIACWVPALKGNFKYLIANHPGVRHALQVDHVVIVGTAKANNFSLKKTEISVFQTSMLTLWIYMLTFALQATYLAKPHGVPVAKLLGRGWFCPAGFRVLGIGARIQGRWDFREVSCWTASKRCPALSLWSWICIEDVGLFRSKNKATRWMTERREETWDSGLAISLSHWIKQLWHFSFPCNLE